MKHGKMFDEQIKQGTGGPVSDKYVCGWCGLLTNKSHLYLDDDGIMHHNNTENDD